MAEGQNTNQKDVEMHIIDDHQQENVLADVQMGNSSQQPCQAQVRGNGARNGVRIGAKRKKGNNRRSEVWNHFTELVDDNGKTKSRCNYCNKTLSTSTLNGTSSMRNHLLCCKQYQDSSKDQTLLKFCNAEGQNGEQVPYLGTWKFAPELVKRVLAEMIILDEMPFSVVEKSGFKMFCHFALPPTFKVPSRRSITRECFNIYVEERLKLKNYFKESGQRVSLTTDTWTSLQRISYMCLTAHYIDENSKLQKRILNFCPVESHKGEELGDLLERCLKDWGIEKVYALTVDNASANNGVIRVLRNALNKWGTAVLGGQDLQMRCAAHIVNLVVSDGTNEKDINQSVSAVRAAVKYIRQSPMRLKRFKDAAQYEEIETRKWLCLDVPTRWNSLYLMLDTAEKFEMAFERYARQDKDMRSDLNCGSNASGFPSCIDWENVRKVVKFLEHFYFLTEQISGSHYPTSHLYFPEISEVESLLEEWEKDVNLYKMAENMKEKRDKYWGKPNDMNKNIFHAVVLDPRHKLDFLLFLLRTTYGSKEGKEYGDMVYAEFRRLFNEYKRMQPGGEQGEVQEVSSGVCDASNDIESRQHSRLHLKSAYKRYKIEMGHNEEKTELEKYLREDTEDDHEDFDILNWWKINALRFPVLAAMARDILAFPISTVASESAFSTGGRVLDAFRSSLTPRMAQALICAQDWLRAKSRTLCNDDEENFGELESMERGFDNLHLDSPILE